MKRKTRRLYSVLGQDVRPRGVIGSRYVKSGFDDAFWLVFCIKVTEGLLSGMEVGNSDASVGAEID